MCIRDSCSTRQPYSRNSFLDSASDEALSKKAWRSFSRPPSSRQLQAVCGVEKVSWHWSSGVSGGSARPRCSPTEKNISSEPVFSTRRVSARPWSVKAKVHRNRKGKG